MSRANVALLAAAVAAGAAAGCTVVLGMPAPSEMSAVEAGADSGSPPLPVPEASPVEESAAMDPEAATTDGGIDAPPDNVVVPDTLRCGGGDWGDASYCAEPGAICCMRTQDAGVSYACAAPAGCSHTDTQYPIACAGAQDCGLNSVCCHYGSHTACTLQFDGGVAAAATACTKSSGSVVCDQLSTTNQCPTGSCSSPLDPEHVYWSCTM